MIRPDANQPPNASPGTPPAIRLAMEATPSPELIRWAESAEYVPLAVVFTDVIGSTRLTRSLGDEKWKEIRETHFRRAREAMSSQRGFQIKTIGDAVMAVFPNSVNAVSFAMDLERNTGDERIRIRAGVHIGELEWNKLDVFGNTVNMAARICRMAKGGGIWISEQVMQGLVARNPEWRAGWTCHENVSLPGLEPDLYRLWSLPPSRDGGVAIDTQRRPAATTTPSTVPVLVSHHQRIARGGAAELFGRDAELKMLDDAWSSAPPNKLNVVTFVAWGGVGKTALVNEWVNRLARDGWRGARRVFEWSFYSQGSDEKRAASADTFTAAALRFFGDPALADSPASAWDKGVRLAQLVAQERSLLVLDGLEPLQHPPGPGGKGVQAGEIKEPAVAALLRGLARNNAGLCVVTTRERVTDLSSFGAAAPQPDLDNLSEEAGSALLRRLLEPTDSKRVHRVESTDAERRAISREVKGHALTLQLLGSYIHKALRDVRRWREVKFVEADAIVQGGHAFRVMDGYVKWLGESGEAGRRQLAVLRVMGLFDRPADPACLAALRKPPIAGLTDALGGLSDEEWNVVLSDLESIGLATVAEWERPRVKGYDEETGRASMKTQQRGYRGDIGEPGEFTPPAPPPAGAVAVDVHPLIREYFAARVRETNPDAWREGHARLFGHLCASVPYWPEGMEGLQPLYQAVAHGCLAGLHEKARADVFRDRILRGTEAGGYYSIKTLGAFGPDLGAVACFFDEAWTRVSDKLTESRRSWLLGEAATRLRALGRLTEGVGPMRAALGMAVTATPPDWHNAARRAGNLSELQLTLGDAGAAVADGKRSVEHADRSGDEFQRILNRTTHADALLQADRRDDARALFVEAEALQGKRQPEYQRLYSVRGFQYCDLILSDAERAAWRCVLDLKSEISDFKSANACDDVTNACNDVTERATQTLAWVTPMNWLLDIGLDNLTLARAALYRAVLSRGAAEGCESVAGGPSPADADPNYGADDKTLPAAALTALTYEHMAAAVDGLRRAGTTHHIPRGLLTRAIYHFVIGDAAAAARDLDEAWEIARRGPMRLHMVDVHLHRARLFRDRGALEEAARLIDETGYHRRDKELADARAAARGWPA
ncbi:MAG: adenylate/guanylate cyclase domain-containing protein [Phycisphaerales bacterium]|nr:adenylate/guanylate cyclase domain-containing protein [Phycisphaerales bacterium]